MMATLWRRRANVGSLDDGQLSGVLLLIGLAPALCGLSCDGAGASQGYNPSYDIIPTKKVVLRHKYVRYIH